MLQQAYAVVVDVDIGKDVLQHGVQDVARLYEVVDARRVDTHDDGTLVMRLTAVELLQHRLLDGDRQDEPIIVGTELHLVDEPLLVLEPRLHHTLRRDVVDGQGEFLIFVVLVEVAVGEVSTPLGSNHLSHQFDGGVVLTAITATLSPDIDPRQLLRAVEPLRSVLVNIGIQLCIRRYAQQ